MKIFKKLSMSAPGSLGADCERPLKAHWIFLIAPKNIPLNEPGDPEGLSADLGTSHLAKF